MDQAKLLERIAIALEENNKLIGEDLAFRKEQVARAEAAQLSIMEQITGIARAPVPQGSVIEVPAPLPRLAGDGPRRPPRRGH